MLVYLNACLYGRITVQPLLSKTVALQALVAVDSEGGKLRFGLCPPPKNNSN